MRITSLITVCGTTMGLFAANAALAQSSTDRDTNRSTQTQRETQQRQTQDRNQNRSATLRGAATANNVLEDLEGIWSIEARVNPSFWAKSANAQGSRGLSATRQDNTDTTRDATNSTRSNRDRSNLNDPEQRERLNNRINDRDTTDEINDRVRDEQDEDTYD